MTLDQAAPVAQPMEAPVATPEEIKMISYDAHRKLLDEKKKVQGELSALQSEKKAREDAEAARRGDFESLLKARDEELAKERGERQQLQSRITTGQKMNAVIESLGGSVDPKWYQLIDVSDVVQNDNGEIDQLTVSRVAESLKKQWPEMIKKTGVLPPNAPQGNGGQTISYDEWKKLPLAEMDKWKQSQVV
jgi:hypothetical protein